MLVQNFLEDSTACTPDKVALVYGDQRLSYQEINGQADHVAASLINMGVRRQDRVCIFLDNSVESVVSLFGILKAGGIFSILSPTMKSKKLNYILKDSGARILITHINKARIVKGAVPGVSSLEHVVWCQGPQKSQSLESILSESEGVNHVPWSSMLEEPESIQKSTMRRCIDVDLATIIYTSGSTGEPKGVMSAHSNMVSAARSITQYLENVQDDIILVALPLSFDYGLYQVLMAFVFGGTVILEKSFVYPYKVLERLVEESATGFPIVPTMVAILLQMDDLGGFDLSSLRYISNTAAALPVMHIRKLQVAFPHVKIFSMYGLTECKRVSYLPPEHIDLKPESVGIPIPNEEVFVVNDDGEQVGPGEIGELVVRGSNVMQGYWNAPEETARIFRPGRYRGDSVLYTGDFFRKDEDGFLYFVSRKDDLIKTKGERVSPKEIEGVLCEMDGVVEAAVIGVPDEIFGQAIKAYIHPKEGSGLARKEILKHCMQNLEPFMIPKHVEFRTSLPRLSSGKLDKKKLGRSALERRSGKERRRGDKGEMPGMRNRRRGEDRRRGVERRVALAV